MSDQEDGSDEQYEHNPDLVPPFLPDQKVFTTKLDQRGGGASSAVPEEPNSSNNGKEEKPEPYFEAVIRQVRHHPNEPPGTDKSWSFLIHFKGWNARYDRWIAASQLVVDTPETRKIFEQQQAEEQAKLEAQKQEKQRKKEQATAAKEQAKAASTEAANNNENDDNIDNVDTVDLPFSLKIVMVDEREKVARLGWDDPWGYDESDMQNAAKMIKANQQPRSIIAREPARSVHALPAEVTIRQFLKHFEKNIRKEWKQKQEEKYNKAVASASDAAAEGGDNKDALGENTQMYKAQLKQKFLEANNQHKDEVRQFRLGIGQLFEAALPKCLLYKQERPQYHYLIQNGNTEQSLDSNSDGKDNKKESTSTTTSALDVYGCEFLLRLILRLPYLMKPLPALLTDMIVHLQRNRSTFFKLKFRSPKFPEEWAEWEQRFYGGPADATTASSSSNTKQQLEDSKPAASATTKKGADKKVTTPSSSDKRKGEESKLAASATAPKIKADKKVATPSSSNNKKAEELGTTLSSSKKKRQAEDSKPAATATSKKIRADEKGTPRRGNKQQVEELGTTPSRSSKQQEEDTKLAATATEKKIRADKKGPTPSSRNKQQAEELGSTLSSGNKKRQAEVSKPAASATAKEIADKKAKKRADKKKKNGSDTG